MFCSTLLLATAAFSGLVAAQNTTDLTLPQGFETCCNVSSDKVPQTQKQAWCRAQTNTCPELCGGQGQVAGGGNQCDPDTLEYTCKCRNQTEPAMAQYEQSVPAQMCYFWYDGCINATFHNGVPNDGEQFGCEQTRDAECGTMTTGDDDDDDDDTSSTATSGSRPTSTGGSGSGGSPTSDGDAPAETTDAPGAAVRLAREYGAPALAGGLVALFGFAL